MKELNRTWLVQRLNKPYKSDGLMAKMSESFAFGSGLTNGGLSKDAMQLLRPIFTFDYMGSSEFEWGAIPKFFKSMAKNIKAYSSHEIIINKIPVYIICETEKEELINDRVKELSNNKIHCKQSTSFNTALGLSKYSKKEDCITFGWIELDNEFMFFTDKEMFQETANLFEIIQTVNEISN